MRGICILGLKLISFFLLTGCSWIDSEGTTHSLIIGLGYVSQATTTGINVVDIGVAGITCDEGISFGLLKKTQLKINPSTAPNAIISVNTLPFSLSIKNINPNNGFLPENKEK
jgi:hypothetical protein